jgi:mono/diheme cytochrome c family protein
MSATLHLIHKISVLIFLVSYFIRLIGLLGNITAIQNLYAKKFMRIFIDMFITTVFLVTGVWMLLNIPGAVLSSFVIIKIVVVFISIPLAVVGFKKSKKALALLSVVLIIAAYGLGEMAKKKPVVQDSMLSNAVGANELFVAGNCAACHGAKGNEPNVSVGAKDLTASTLTQEQIMHVISKGKNSMPGYKSSFSEEQIKELTDYVMSLRSSPQP